MSQPLDTTRSLALRDQVSSMDFFRWAANANSSDLDDLEHAARTMLAIIHCEQAGRARHGNNAPLGVAE